ncbi:MAG: murein hydrolase activator EnvC [Candidatus Dormibacteria bacterium]
MRWTAAALAGIVAGVAVTPTSADQISDKQHQREQVGGFINNLKGQISQTQDKETQLRSVIAGVDAQITQTKARIAVAQAELQRITEDLAAEQDRLEKAEAQLALDKQQLASDMKLAYIAGNDSTPLNNLLTSGDFNEFWRRLFELRRISDGQHTATETVHKQRDLVQTSVRKIGDDQKRQRSTVNGLNNTLNDLDVQLQSRQAAQQILVGVEAQDNAQLAQNEQAAHQLDNEIASLREAQRRAAEAARRRAEAEAAARSAAQRRQSAQSVLGDVSSIVTGGGGSGQFQWPERGPITQGFGCTPYTMEPYDAGCRSKHFHSGIDIAAPGGNPVAAADAGTAFAYRSSYGFGNHVIIVHGGGFATVYGHLSGFNVGNGESVGRGRVIGYEGSTGNSTGPHLHFEIRLNESPVNPFNYLP